jgi:hypothetical protein
VTLADLFINLNERQPLMATQADIDTLASKVEKIKADQVAASTDRQTATASKAAADEAAGKAKADEGKAVTAEATVNAGLIDLRTFIDNLAATTGLPT